MIVTTEKSHFVISLISSSIFKEYYILLTVVIWKYPISLELISHV